MADNWGNLYQQALDETDPGKILGRVHAVEGAMFERWLELASLPNEHETRAMNVAADGLLRIKLEKLKWMPIGLAQSNTESHVKPRPPLNYSRSAAHRRQTPSLTFRKGA